MPSVVAASEREPRQRRGLWLLWLLLSPLALAVGVLASALFRPVSVKVGPNALFIARYPRTMLVAGGIWMRGDWAASYDLPAPGDSHLVVTLLHRGPGWNWPRRRSK